MDDEELLLAGVPNPLLASVRALKAERDLDALAPHLPDDATDMLYLLAAGYDFMQALEEASRPKETVAAVDVGDFSEALARPETQSLFHLVEGEQELEQMLDAPMEQWRVFLHPSQRRLVRRHTNGPSRVLGGAGTGKTVVLIHRTKYLAEEVFNAPDDRLLVTTFTRNLTADLAASLKSICPGAIDRIEVRNLHAWARSFYEQQVGRRVAVLDDEGRRRELMTQAATTAPTDAFRSLVLSRRVGPDRPGARHCIEGRVLPGPSRRPWDSAWSKTTGRKSGPCFPGYRELVDSEGLLEWQDVVREARLYIEGMSAALPYNAVLADEVQDLTPPELKLLRAIVSPGPNDLFLVGDAHQRDLRPHGSPRNVRNRDPRKSPTPKAELSDHRADPNTGSRDP